MMRAGVELDAAIVVLCCRLRLLARCRCAVKPAEWRARLIDLSRGAERVRRVGRSANVLRKGATGSLSLVCWWPRFRSCGVSTGNSVTTRSHHRPPSQLRLRSTRSPATGLLGGTRSKCSSRTTATAPFAAARSGSSTYSGTFGQSRRRTPYTRRSALRCRWSRASRKLSERPTASTSKSRTGFSVTSRFGPASPGDG